MFDINTVPKSEREHITRNLRKWGIAIDQQTGKIEYIPGFTLPEVKCASMHLIRHAETEAVAKHEFMSDTSENWHFTPEGIEITHAQAKQLDSYGFDIALYGPIPRVAHTMELIMQTPQKFDALKVHKLHGIDNTGWEYKSFEQLQHDPTFVAREVENNMFARTPSGTSWGMVIANCVDVIDLINECYAGKKILLISQGSVLRAMQILLRARKHPWDDYTVEGMYHVGDDAGKKKNYGLISWVYGGDL